MAGVDGYAVSKGTLEKCLSMLCLYPTERVEDSAAEGKILRTGPASLFAVNACRNIGPNCYVGGDCYYICMLKRT